MVGAHDNAAPTARPTLRVLAQLGIEIPELASGLDELSHPICEKARSLASAYPQNLVRIQGITDALVYRFTHGRWRVIAWQDEASNVLWVCACELRSDDTYDDVLAWHARGELLPADADEARISEEATLRLGRELASAVPSWIRSAREHDGTEQRFALSNGAEVRLLLRSTDGLEELWLAMPTLTAGAPGLAPNTRALIAALAERELDSDAVWESRHDWPTGSLLRWEVARLGVSATK